MKSIRFLIPALLAGGLLVAAQLPSSTAPVPRVLVYTRNHVTGGKGFVHDNIAASVEMLKTLGQRGGFEVEASDDPKMFTDEKLRPFRALIFSNSNNEAFENDEQRDAFRRFIQAGGGFVGIHSASGSERKWPYYWAVLGGKFKRHAPMQPFKVLAVDTNHPATLHLGLTWNWTDEFYYSDNLNPRLHVLLTGDLTSVKDPPKTNYPGAVFGDHFPVAWCQEFDGGRQFYTALGHKIEHYSDAKFQQHVLGGILWTLNKPLPAASKLAK